MGDYRIPFVFDNLIYRREMAVTIGDFINPGHTAEQKEASDADRGERSTSRRVDYNALDDTYARFIVDELLPALKKQYNLSDDPECGATTAPKGIPLSARRSRWARRR